MEFIKSWKFMAIIFGVLTVVSIAGVVVGVMTHEEPGLMENVPQWNRGDFPLGVCARTYSVEAQDTDLSTEHDAVLQYAISTTNSRLGFTAFRRIWRGSGERCLVFMVLDEPQDSVTWMDRGGDALLDQRHGSLTCDVRVSNVFGELLDLVIQHELGHCLGLDHDSYDASIMRPTQHETPAGQFPPRLSDHDREILRRLYGPR